jgi:hypothetical protein
MSLITSCGIVRYFCSTSLILLGASRLPPPPYGSLIGGSGKVKQVMTLRASETTIDQVLSVTDTSQHPSATNHQRLSSFSLIELIKARYSWQK